MDRALTLLAATIFLAAVASSASAAGDPEHGKQLFGRCAMCHKADKDAGNGFGPNLFGVVGRKAGTAPDFAYSPAMKSSGIVWSEERLEAYMTSPSAVVPGNRMPFAGVKNHDDVDDIAAFLLTLK
jgi:cytochrome c